MIQIADNISSAKGYSKSLVSVIMPFLNTHKFIKGAIESVLDQTYSHWELLLIDDGSVDGSTEISQQFAQLYPEKIYYFEHKGHQNKGASASRNIGLQNAKGEYIAFLDSDDVWLPFNLNLLVVQLNSHPEAAMVYGPTRWWYSWTGNEEDKNRDFDWDLGLDVNTLYHPPSLIIPYFLTGTITTPCTCSILIRSEAVKIAGKFEENFKYIYTDQVFYAKVSLKLPIFVIGECGAMYRQHPDSSCAIVEKTGKAFDARSKFLRWLKQYLLDQKLEDPNIRQELKKALISYDLSFRYRLLISFQNVFSRIKKFVTLIPLSKPKGLFGLRKN